MFARIVTFPLKPNTSAQFSKTVENTVIPMLRTHKGFLDQIALVTPDGKTSYGISFWDTKEHAEAYQRSGYAEVMKALDSFISAPSHVQVCKVTNSTAHHIAPARVA